MYKFTTKQNEMEGTTKIEKVQCDLKEQEKRFAPKKETSETAKRLRKRDAKEKENTTKKV